MNRFYCWDDLFNIIPDDADVLNALSDGEYDWTTSVGAKRMPYNIIKSLGEGNFDVETIMKHFECFIGEIYCSFDFTNIDVANNTCDLMVTDDSENTRVYSMRKDVKDLLYNMMWC